MATYLSENHNSNNNNNNNNNDNNNVLFKKGAIFPVL
jgi:hypothetical protein